MSHLTIKNCTIVNEGKLSENDLLIKNGRIEKIDTSIDVKGDFIEAEGLHLLPGFIDDQVHFREPGLTDKGSIRSESTAAVVGGTTSFMDMPNVIPPTLNVDLWNQKNRIAEQGSLANYSFYMGSSNTNIEEIKSIDPSQVCGLKVFMGSSTGNLLVDDPKALENIFNFSPVLITTHGEDTPLITENEKKAYEKFGDNIPIELHEEIRSRQACLISTKKAINLAKQFNSKLHVLHISTKDEIELFDAGLIENKKISLEKLLRRLPGGLNGNLGEEGINLSGGEIQRIGLCRALIYDPEILFLDEATSSLDVNTESEILDELKIFKEKTIISIAHRINTLKNCDKIYRLNNGKVVDEGGFDKFKMQN